MTLTPRLEKALQAFFFSSYRPMYLTFDWHGMRREAELVEELGKAWEEVLDSRQVDQTGGR